MNTHEIPGYNLFQAHLFEDKYIVMYWPKQTTLKWLQHAKEMVNFQLDMFIVNAARDEPRKEYARIEVESWEKS